MLSTIDAIKQRRSIRRFKKDPIPEKVINALLEAARWAPSGCNAQPWRFKIITEPAPKKVLSGAAFGQKSIAYAPVVLVCCADIQRYIDGTISNAQDLGNLGTSFQKISQALKNRAAHMKTMPVAQIGAFVGLNVAIAIEHMVLRALDFGLGSCWVRLFDADAVKEIFGWDDTIYPVALLPLGYPAESPPDKPRVPISDLLL